MDERLKQIAGALEKQNDLFREWIDLNRAAIEQNMKMRAEYFPLEMEKARLDVATMKGFIELEDKMGRVASAVDKVAEAIPASATTPAK